MSTRAIDRPFRSLAPLIVVTAAALVFAILLVLVRLQWPPLESVDHGAAARLNGLVAGDALLVTAVKAVTWLGSDGVLWTVVGATAIVLACSRYRLPASQEWPTMTAVMRPDEQGRACSRSAVSMPVRILVQPYASTGALEGLEPRARRLRDPRSLAP
jgi:hypothetical protein